MHSDYVLASVNGRSVFNFYVTMTAARDGMAGNSASNPGHAWLRCSIFSGGWLTAWLSRAPTPVFALYGGLMAFGAYFAMYAFRKPFTVAHFAGAASVIVKYKIALVIVQVLGYALSKVAGVKFISEMPPQH